MNLHVLLMRVIKVFPVSHRGLLLKILEDGITRLECLHHLDISLGGLNRHLRIFKHDHGAVSFINLFLEVLFLLKLDESALLLTIFHHGLD